MASIEQLTARLSILEQMLQNVQFASSYAPRIDVMERQLDDYGIPIYDPNGKNIGLVVSLQAGAGVTLARTAGTKHGIISASGAPAAHNILSSSHDATVAAAASGDIVRRNAANTAWERLAIGTAGQKLGNSGGLAAWLDDSRGPIMFQIGDGTNVIPTGVYAEFTVGYACTATLWSLYSTLPQAGGALQLDLWKCTHAQYDSGATHPVVGDTITGTDKPRIIATATKGQSSALTGWTTAFAKDDIVRINVDSVTAIKLALLSIDIKAAA